MVFMFRFIEFRNSEENQRRKLQSYAFRELKAATDNFSSKNIVGKGGFGKVFKGQLGDGSFIAIKRISALTTDARLRVCREAEISTMIMHQNLVSLIGICMRWNEILLVYPLVSKGSVARCLRELHPPLDWQTRRRIALGVARGLAHLHDDCKILHRDVKTENVLLDERFEPAITDFGLSQLLDQNTNSVQPPPTLSPERSASGFIRSLRIFKSKKPDGSTRQLTLAEELLKKHKWRSQFANQWQWKRNKPKSKKTNWPLERSMPLRPARGEDSADRTPSLDRELLPDWSRRSTGICGTIGYIAPESIATGMRTYKHDVYGYGVTLLELISGGRVFSLTWPSKGIFAFQDWVKQLLKDTEVETLVDPRLQGNYIVDEVKQLIMLAQTCLQYSPNERPKMSEVVTMLEGNGLVERWEEWQNGRLSCEDNRAQGLNNGSETESTSYYSLSPPDESFVQ